MDIDIIIFIVKMTLGIFVINELQKYLTLKKEFFEKSNTQYNSRELFTLKFLKENNNEALEINKRLKICWIMIISWGLILWFL